MRTALHTAVELLVALLIAFAAWHIGRRKGQGAMLAFWPVAAIIVNAVITWPVQAAMGKVADPDLPAWLRSPFWTMLPMWIIGIGAMMLPLSQAIREPDGKFGVGLILRCTVAFVFGVMVYFAAFFGYMLTHLPG